MYFIQFVYVLRSFTNKLKPRESRDFSLSAAIFLYLEYSLMQSIHINDIHTSYITQSNNELN